MKERFKINDYVVYDGDVTALEPKRRNKDYAKIIERKKIGDIDYVGLQLISLKEQISCPLSEITHIETTKLHLINLGFKEEKSTDKLVYYVKNNMFISKLSLIIPLSKYNNNFFITGFCLADFRAITNDELEKYKNGSQIDMPKFYNDFPNLNNVNDLFDIIEMKENIIINREKIINPISTF